MKNFLDLASHYLTFELKLVILLCIHGVCGKKLLRHCERPSVVKLNRSHFLSVYQRTTQEFGGGSKEGKLIESDVHFLHNFYDKAPNKMTFFFF